jgi:DNA-binding XRE family transcriptional regulator
METAAKITEVLETIKARHQFTDEELAQYAGVSRWTIYRIRRGDIGETVSTSLVGTILREYTPLAEQAA